MQHGRFEEAERELLDDGEILSVAPGVSVRRRNACRDALINLYDTWHEQQPDGGCDVEAAHWREQLEAVEQPGS